jgi:ferrochelatase
LAAVICPIGFVCDHIEVLWDLDEEAAAVCRDVGIEMTRAEAANADPVFIEMIADVVMRAVRRAERGRLLPLAMTPTDSQSVRTTARPGPSGRPPSA